MKNRIVPILLTLTAVWFVRCTKAPSPEQPPAKVDTSVLDPFFSTTQIEGTPVPIPVARKQHQPGDTVLVDGKIMGVLHPFVEGRAVFVLGDDDTLTSCDEMGKDDHCPTPWDACCDSKEVLREGVATIQFADHEGKVIRQGLKGVHGLRELSHVRVSGTLAPGSSSEAMIINADKIVVLGQ